MILLIAVAVGLISGLVRAKISGNHMRMVDVRYLWIVLVAYIPQFFTFYFLPTQNLIHDNWVPFILVTSQALLIIFVWINRKTEGFWLLGLGLLCNFTAIVLNGGLMPIMPETLHRMFPSGIDSALEIGKRVGLGKDILLIKEEITLWFLGDIFTLPPWMCYPLAFSFGDIFLSIGAFWLLFELGRPQKNPQEVSL
ncbi:MAG: DUF5317 domain-containing protein [Pelolinea sp.]|nr:DUF5317 domain-containing protein [Pelolinea sp.]